jgi:hypothetical protein
VVSVLTSSIVALALLVLACPSWSQTGPIIIPKKGDPGWMVTQTDSSRPAPAGYEGRTDTSTLTAVGNAPETAGRRIVARFTLGNQIKTCPNADGTAEGEGVFSLSVESTNQQPTGTTRQQIEMRTKGTYKGDVGDDAWIKNPVKAEIDYTYKLSGTFRDPSGAIATPAASDVSQHLTFPFSVGGAMTAPQIGAFSGGDPTKGHYADAFGAGNALVYWAGVYYSIAQTKWRQPRTCVDIEFTPPSSTVKVVPGGKTTVDAEVKTKAGEGVKAHFQDARGYQGGGVSPAEGTSDVGSPMKFTFIAPAQKATKPGFGVDATSRAGVAQGEWFAGLGTGWSGHISYTYTHTGDHGENEQQTWSYSTTTRISADLKDGKGTANGFTEIHDMKRQRQRALRGGSITLINAMSALIEGSFADSAPATVDVVMVNPSTGTYTVQLEYIFKEGKSRTQMCGRTDCRDSEAQLLIGPFRPGITGRTDDPNHVKGSKTDTRNVAG